MEKILISENIGLALGMINAMKSVLPDLNEILDAIRRLEIGEVNQDLFNDALFNGCLIIEREFNARFNAELEKLSPLVRKVLNVKKGSDIESLRIMASGVYNYTLKDYQPGFKFIEVIDGKAVLTEQGEDGIKEYCKKYVSTPAGNELYKAHVRAVSALNSLDALMKKHLDKSGYSAATLGKKLNMFFKENEDGEIEIMPMAYDNIVG